MMDSLGNMRNLYGVIMPYVSLVLSIRFANVIIPNVPIEKKKDLRKGQRPVKNNRRHNC